MNRSRFGIDLTVQFRKTWEAPRRSVTFSKVAGFSLNFTKHKTAPWVSFTFF